MLWLWAVACIPRSRLFPASTMDHQQDSVRALLSLLESYPPEVLSPFLERVENLALNVRRSRCQQRDAPLEQLDASSIDSVLSNGHLLAMILEYDGSLAMGHVSIFD